MITDVKLFNGYENVMRQKHVETKMVCKNYIRLNKFNLSKQNAQKKAFLKDEEEIKRMLREQKNQWRKEQKTIKGKQQVGVVHRPDLGQVSLLNSQTKHEQLDENDGEDPAANDQGDHRKRVTITKATFNSDTKKKLQLIGSKEKDHKPAANSQAPKNGKAP
jgi:hypothetical protein